MTDNVPTAMKYDYFVRWFKNGKWQAVNVKELTEDEFRQYICYWSGLVGVLKEAK